MTATKRKFRYKNFEFPEMKKNIFSFLLLITCISCNTDTSKVENTTTGGYTKVISDISFQPIIDTEEYTFESLYKYAKVDVKYKPEADVINDFMNDSVQTMIISRQLTTEEEKYLQDSKSYYPRTTKIAYDALAFIVNKENPDSLIRYDILKKIFTGEFSTWKQIHETSKLGQLKIVFDNLKSANTRFIREKFAVKDSFPNYCFAVNTNQEVIKYVEKNINAIGIISVSWVSDRDDPQTMNFLKIIKVLHITSEIDPQGIDYYGPYQAYIATLDYPFRREVYMICKETFAGLGSGFTQFIAGETGQRIILKSGIMPANMPIRLIQTKNSF